MPVLMLWWVKDVFHLKKRPNTGTYTSQTSNGAEPRLSFSGVTFLYVSIKNNDLETVCGHERRTTSELTPLRSFLGCRMIGPWVCRHWSLALNLLSQMKYIDKIIEFYVCYHIVNLDPVDTRKQHVTHSTYPDREWASWDANTLGTCLYDLVSGLSQIAFLA